MKRLIATLPIFILLGVITATSALAVSDSVTVSANITQSPPGSVTIAIKDAEIGGSDLTAMAFGNVPNTQTDHRTKQTTPAGGAFVDYFAGPGTHEIRVWFDNYPALTSDPTKVLAGLKATVGGVDYFWPLKVWCPNYGPAGFGNSTGGADPENNTYWNENYSWIFERAYKVNGFGNTGLPVGYPAGIYKDETRSKLSWFYPVGTAKRPGGALDARLSSRYRVDLAIDSFDAAFAQVMSTTYSGTLVFDLEQSP